jgi:hypothetical protein
MGDIAGAVAPTPPRARSAAALPMGKTRGGSEERKRVRPARARPRRPSDFQPKRGRGRIIKRYPTRKTPRRVLRYTLTRNSYFDNLFAFSMKTHLITVMKTIRSNVGSIHITQSPRENG